VSQLLAREKGDDEKAVPSGVLIQMLRKGRGTLFGYGKKYISLWQSAFTMSRDEIEKLVNALVKDKELSEFEGKSLKKEIASFTSNLKTWIIENIDQRVDEVLKMMNLATKDHVDKLIKKVENLSQQVKDLENRK
jgi:polyhydroxyalkanoate synthesis regulator phasin